MEVYERYEIVIISLLLTVISITMLKKINKRFQETGTHFLPLNPTFMNKLLINNKY